MSLFGSQSSSEKLQPAPPGEGRDLAIQAHELVLIHQPHSRTSEQFRNLRNSLLALNPDGASRTVLLTSSIRGEGKTVAALNLALALVEMPQLRVLVIDGDIPNPSVERYLGLPRRQGLHELLAGEISIDQAIRPTSVKRLDILGSGTRQPNPVVNVDRIHAVLNSLKRRYDYVLLDGPAVLQANVPSVLGSIADGILLVVRVGYTPKQLVEEAYAMLENLGGNVLGTCVTDAGGEER